MNENIKAGAGALSPEIKQKFENRRESRIISISFDQLESECNEAGLSSFFNELCLYSIDYARDIFELDNKREQGYSINEEGSREAIEHLDAKRSTLHTALQDQVRILVRNLSKNEVDVSWARKLTDSTGDISRAAAGALALELAGYVIRKAKEVYDGKSSSDKVGGGHL